jgi:hypothetical protein
MAIRACLDIHLFREALRDNSSGLLERDLAPLLSIQAPIAR